MGKSWDQTTGPGIRHLHEAKAMLRCQDTDWGQDQDQDKDQDQYQ